MALIFMDGFDKYGGLNTNATSPNGLIGQEWTSVSGATIVAPLSATGFAVQLGLFASAAKTLPGNYGRLIGGIRFKMPDLTNYAGIQLNESGTAQASVTVDTTTGTISVRTGGSTGTALGTSTASVLAGSTHYLEFDITINNTTGSYQVWLDGVSILSGSGNTRGGTGNNYTNGIQLAGTGANPIYDDLYVFDTTGTTNNAALLTSPRIETTFPTGDGSVQFAFGAATLGSSVARGSGSFSTGLGNILYVVPRTPTRNCTINSISFLPTLTSSMQLRPIVYTDVANSPSGGTLLSSGSTVAGLTNGSLLTLPLTTPQSLTAGTQYWIGLHMDTAGSNMGTSVDASNSAYYASATFSSGAPSTFPGSPAGGQANATIYGNITLASPVNWYEVASQPPQGTASYVYDGTVGHEDLYTLPALSAPATSIYAVAVKANVAKSDAGTRTVSVRAKSGATDSAGSVSSFAPATTFGWLDTLFPTDPATGAAWTLTAVNAMQAGVKIET